MEPFTISKSTFTDIEKMPDQFGITIADIITLLHKTIIFIKEQDTMYEIRDVAQDLKSAVKRRYVLLVVTPIIFLSAAYAALYFIDPMYRSSTTILVEKDETLNPLVLYDMAVSITSEDRLKSLNEIIYSRSTMEILIDSLNLDKNVRSEEDKQMLIENIQNNIGISSGSSDVFKISFFNTDPVKAATGAQLLANHFIETKVKMETRRHEETVAFFKNKLNELESIVNEQRNQSVNITTDRLKNLPSDTEGLQNRLQNIEEQMESIEWQIFKAEQNLDLIEEFQDQSEAQGSVNQLYKLPLTEMQHGEELLALLNEYDNLQQQFTESYPRLRTLAGQISQVADRIPPTIESNLRRLKSQKTDLKNQKGQVVSDLQRSYIASQRASSQQTDFSIYEGLYNEMKVKLEQAKMNRDIGKSAADQFIVLDAAVIPENPSSPNKTLILGIGLLLGIIMGVIFSAVAEVMDSTLRDDSDIPYDKPIIAYISNG